MTAKKIYLPVGVTVYGKAAIDSTPWANDAVALTGSGPVYAGDTDNPFVYLQVGGSPADVDLYIGVITDLYYGDLVEGNIFHNARLHSYDWNNATEADRLRALYHATAFLNQFNYICDKADPDQVMAFPRTGDTVAPLEIRQATYLIADALLSGRDPEEDFEALMTKVETFGSVRTEFETSHGPQQHIANLIPSPAAWALVKPFLRISTSFDVNKG